MSKFQLNPITGLLDLVGESSSDNGDAISADEKGTANGVTPLGADTKVPTQFLTLTNPVAIPDPPTAPTADQLRVTMMQMLTALRNARLAIPQLTYSVAAGGTYTYNSSSHTISAIRDGVLNSGMMVTNSAKVFVQTTFATPSRLRAIAVYLGQFNGGFNMPRNLAIFAGAVTVDTGIPLYSGTLATVVSAQTIDLSAIPEFDELRSTFTFVFSNSTGGVNVSVNELQLFGT